MGRIFAVLFLIIVMASCDSNTVVSEVQSLPSTWDKDAVIQFKIPELDSLKKYDVFINLRNTNDYPYNNIFLIVQMNFPHGKVVADTLEYRMANPDGTWLGEGIGNVKENKLFYKEGVTFSEAGTYVLEISHAVRNNGSVEGVTNLEGITDVGYSIEESISPQ